MTHTIILIIASILLVPGIIMAIIPAIPGMLYMLIIALFYAFYDRFVHVTLLDLGILALITALAMIIDTVSGLIGAKWGGAHWTAIVSGFVGLILGSAFIPVPIVGSLAGMFFGILASEWYRTRNVTHAHRAATGSLIGSLAGTGVKIAASVAFFALFIFFAVR